MKNTDFTEVEGQKWNAVRRTPSRKRRSESLHPMGRAGTPDEVASAVWQLCTEATWTTGQAIAMDGGLTVTQG